MKTWTSRCNVAALLQQLVAHVIRRTGEGTVEILDHDRYARERALQLLAAPGARLLVQRVDHGVEFAVELLDAIDGSVDQFERRRRSRTDQLGLGGRVEK